jgi:hypothetical protein
MRSLTLWSGGPVEMLAAACVPRFFLWCSVIVVGPILGEDETPIREVPFES